MKLKLTIIALALSFSSIVVAGNAKDSITAAKNAQKEAKALGFEWTTMSKMIKKSEALAKAGKDKKAMKVADTVTSQLVVIKKQAELAKTAGPTF